MEDLWIDFLSTNGCSTTALDLQAAAFGAHVSRMADTAQTSPYDQLRIVKLYSACVLTRAWCSRWSYLDRYSSSVNPDLHNATAHELLGLADTDCRTTQKSNGHVL